MEGREFRQLSEEEMGNVVPKLQVLARSSPSDKYILGALLPSPLPRAASRPPARPPALLQEDSGVLKDHMCRM